MLTKLTIVCFVFHSLICIKGQCLDGYQADVYGTLKTPSSETYEDVCWYITAPSGYNVYIQIISLQLSGSDYLAAYDGYQITNDNLILQASNGYKTPSSFISSSSNVTVRYAGDPTKSQFQLSYSLPVSSSQMLSTSTNWQSFTSPNYPNNYYSNSDIIWMLYAPVHYVIEIRFNSFNTEKNKDFLIVYDGDSTFMAPYIEYTGDDSSNISSHIFASTGNYLTLRFTSSSTNEMTGFLINYVNYQGGESITTEPPPVTTSTAIAPGGYCSGNGNYTCNCFHGYTGHNCESEIDFCAELIDDYTGGYIPAGQLCLPHGVCVSSPSGASCNCSRGFEGQFCENEVPNETTIASRCSLYPTNFTLSNDVPLGCASGQVCIPDHMNCAVVGTCAKPLGWCIPSASAGNYIAELITILNSQLPQEKLYKMYSKNL